MRQKILVVEDEIKIQDLIRDLLVDEYDVLVAGSGQAGVDAARSETPDLILMDALMPEMDGLLACRFIRKCAGTKDIPIIMLTALKEPDERIKAFSSGADDFISKPFHPDELITRIESKLQRFASLKGAQKSLEIQSGNLRMDVAGRTLTVAGDARRLTVIEFDILKCLLEAAGAPRSRKQLLATVWGDESVPIRILDSHILAIRRKLDGYDRAIETVYGHGYVIRE
jgi:DNA-binding response OmpR family regulator